MIFERNGMLLIENELIGTVSVQDPLHRRATFTDNVIEANHVLATLASREVRATTIGRPSPCDRSILMVIETLMSPDAVARAIAEQTYRHAFSVGGRWLTKRFAEVRAERTERNGKPKRQARRKGVLYSRTPPASFKIADFYVKDEIANISRRGTVVGIAACSGIEMAHIYCTPNGSTERIVISGAMSAAHAFRMYTILHKLLTGVPLQHEGMKEALAESVKMMEI